MRYIAMMILGLMALIGIDVTIKVINNHLLDGFITEWGVGYYVGMMSSWMYIYGKREFDKNKCNGG